ncbi:MAG: hypothetical protein WD009_14035 [Phycisphaeraceae bacterium]
MTTNATTTHDWLREEGGRCATLIRQEPSLWRHQATWLRRFPIRGQRRKTTFGPVSQRLVEAMRRVLEPFSGRPSEDRFHGLSEDVARRILLLVALVYDPDFECAALGLRWPWDAGGKFGRRTGRSWARPILSTPEGQEDFLAAVVRAAMAKLWPDTPLQPLPASSTQDGHRKSVEPERGTSADAPVGLIVSTSTDGETEATPRTDGASQTGGDRPPTGSDHTRGQSAAASDNDGATPDGDVYLAVADLAKAAGLPPERVPALRKAMERWRKNHLEGWIENMERRAHEPRYLYRAAAVKHVVESVRQRYNLSVSRPSKKKGIRQAKDL